MEAPDRYDLCEADWAHWRPDARRVYAAMLAALDEGLGNLTRNELACLLAQHGQGRLILVRRLPKMGEVFARQTHCLTTLTACALA